VPMSGSEREHVSLLRHHAHAAGSLAQAVADAVSPLALSKSLQVAVQSFGVCIEALRSLAATTETVELDTNKARLPLLLLLLLRAASLQGACLDRITASCAMYQQGNPCVCPPLVGADPDAGAQAHRCGCPRPRNSTASAQRAPGLGPASGGSAGAVPVLQGNCIHTFWAASSAKNQIFCCPRHPTAVCCLQDWRVSVIEAALQFLADAACLAGGALHVHSCFGQLPAVQGALLGQALCR
jgi:hypothetical protein